MWLFILHWKKYCARAPRCLKIHVMQLRIQTTNVLSYCNILSLMQFSWRFTVQFSKTFSVLVLCQGFNSLLYLTVAMFIIKIVNLSSTTLNNNKITNLRSFLTESSVQHGHNLHFYKSIFIVMLFWRFNFRTCKFIFWYESSPISNLHSTFCTHSL